MLVSWMCGYFLSPKKCNLRPTKVQRYLGMLCDSDTASFRVPPDKMATLHNLLSTALAAGGNFLPHARTHRGEVHEHDGSHPSGVSVDTCHVHSAFEAREIEVAPDRFVESRVWRTPRGVSPVDKHFIHIARGPVTGGPPLYGVPRRRRYGRILHRVGGRSQRGGSTVSRGGRLPGRLAGAARQQQGDVRVVPRPTPVLHPIPRHFTAGANRG